MILVVQEITTWWTKRSRSGEEAGRRAATPRRLPLPEAAASDGPALVHQKVTCDEARGFAPETNHFEAHPIAQRQALEFGCSTVRFLGERVETVWGWRFSCGAPERSEFRRTVLTLQAGEWGRVESNGRFSSLFGMAGWRYRLHVVNVALREEAVIEPFRGDPVKEFSALADLW